MDTTLQDYVQILVARRWIVVAVTALTVAIGLAYAVLSPSIYVATASLQFGNQQDFSILGLQVPVDLNPGLTAAADSRIVTRADVVANVQSLVHSGLSDDQLRAKISATVEPTSNLILVQASTRSAALSVRIANAFANETKVVIALETRQSYAVDAQQLRAALAAGGVPTQTAATYQRTIARLGVLSKVADPVSVIRPATAPRGAASPKPVLDIVLAAVLGLILGVVAAFVRNALDRRLANERGIQETLLWPVVGRFGEAMFAARVGADDISRDDLDAVRILRTNVGFLTPNGEPSSIAVTSPSPDDGKSTVAAWYGYANAVTGRRTLLVDTDLRRSHSPFPGPGLSDYLAGRASWDESLRTIDVSRPADDEPVTLAYLPAGTHVLEPAGVIGSERFQQFVAEMTDEYDLVVFDCPALLSASEARDVVLRTDATLLCVRLGKTTKKQIHAAQEAIERLPARLLGVVVTGIRHGDREFGGHEAQPARRGRLRTFGRFEKTT
ncbi:MAG TPA: Wzz/FepE/Etk N-terminal domain-containing protein [Gaiellaceae bacterium]|jgi:Mrp family chromosome partitioning ATPase